MHNYISNINKTAMSWILQLVCIILIPQLGLGSTLEKDIFLLGGESNMVGQGGVFHGKWDGYQPPEDRPDPKIYRLGPVVQGWQRAGEPLHSGIDIEGTWGVGPGIPFAHEVLKASGSKYGSIGLVPCARTGSRVANWSRGQFYYNELIRRANESIQEGGEIRALLWYQGESDTVFKADAHGFKQNTENFFKDLRSDLNMPSLLIIQVAIAVGDGNFTETIRQDQMAINLPNVKLIDAKGLLLERDHQHLSTNAQVQLGQKMAQIYLNSSGHYP